MSSYHWEELDKLYPKQADKFSRARSRVISNGTPLETLAAMLDLPLEMLRARSSDEGWESLRFEHLKSSSVEAAEAILAATQATLASSPDNDLERHITSADAAVRMGENLILALANSETNERDLKIIRAKIEAFRSLAEGLESVIKTSRSVRGIKNDQPSKVVEKESTKVIYETVIVPARQTA